MFNFKRTTNAASQKKGPEDPESTSSSSSTYSAITNRSNDVSPGDRSPSKVTFAESTLWPTREKSRKYSTTTPISTSSTILVPHPSGDNEKSREELLDLVKILREKILALQVDFSAEKVLRRKKEKNILKLAQELNNRSIEVETKKSVLSKLKSSLKSTKTELKALKKSKAKSKEALLIAQIDEETRKLSMKTSYEDEELDEDITVWRIIGVIVAIIVVPSIFLANYMDLLSISSFCSPCMPGTILDNSTLYDSVTYEAPWWVPKVSVANVSYNPKPLVFDWVCSQRNTRRTRLDWASINHEMKSTSQEHKLVITDITSDGHSCRGGICLERKAFKVQINSQFIAIYVGKTKVLKRKAPWVVS